MKVAEFVDRMASRMDANRDKAQVAYRAFLVVLRESLSRGEEVRLEGLGKLVSTPATAKTGRPQKSSEVERVVEVTFVQFRSSKTDLVRMCPFDEEFFND